MIRILPNTSLLILVIVVCVHGFTLQKCCPLHQLLDIDFKKCIDYNHNNNSNNSSEHNTTSYSSPEVVEDSDLPWWFPQEVQILSADTLLPVSAKNSFLKGESSLEVKYGVDLPCSFHTTRLLVGDTFLDDGSLVEFDEDTDDNNTYPSIAFCADLVNVRDKFKGNDTKQETRSIIKLCPCVTEVCIRKCCAEGKLMKIDDSGRCVSRNNLTEEWRPKLLSNGTNDTMFTTIFGKQFCNFNKSPILLNPTVDHQHKFWILENGKIHIEKLGVTMDLPYREYCAETTEYADGTRVPNLVYCEYTSAVEVVKKGTLFGVLFVIGAVFLTATLVVYALTPELRSLHGNNLMSHTASFLVAYIAMAAGQLDPDMPYKPCVAIGFIIQFSSLAAFFWLNVMCIDISWTFSGLRPPQGSAKVRDQKKYRYYSLYAWGSTGLISLVTAVMEFTPAITHLKPGFGITSCLFKEAIATLVYFYIPMALLLITNLALFLYTAARILAVKRQTAILHKPGSAAYNKEKQRLILYIKLFLLMGLTWTTEIISWAVGGPDYYWYLTDVLNLLRAVFIFVIFCCKRQVYHHIRERMNKTFRTKSSRCRLGSKQETLGTDGSENSPKSASKRRSNLPNSTSSLASQTQETVLNF